MKQHITEKQFDELPDKIMIKIYDNFKFDGEIINLLNYEDINIGTMIEFLGDDWYKHFFIVTSYDAVFPDQHPLNKDLCDALWEAVKEVLENE